MTDKDKENCMAGDCGCGDEADYLTLEFDDGQEVECEIMGVFDLDGKEYIALIQKN